MTKFDKIWQVASRRKDEKNVLPSYNQIWRALPRALSHGLHAFLKAVGGPAQTSCCALRRGTIVLRKFSFCGVDLADEDQVPRGGRFMGDQLIT